MLNQSMPLFTVSAFLVGNAWTHLTIVEADGNKLLECFTKDIFVSPLLFWSVTLSWLSSEKDFYKDDIVLNKCFAGLESPWWDNDTLNYIETLLGLG